jgi:hypothetical protein
MPRFVVLGLSSYTMLRVKTLFAQGVPLSVPDSNAPSLSHIVLPVMVTLLAP